tara:strand:- start:297 stop:419 length:123 start_codon:yes stop_codon:yes gene_type:complete
VLAVRATKITHTKQLKKEAKMKKQKICSAILIVFLLMVEL